LVSTRLRLPMSPLFPYTTLFRSDRSLLDRIGLFDLRAVRFGGEGLAGQVLVGAGHEVLPGGQGDRVAPHAAAAQVGVADLEVARADVALRVAEPHGGGHLPGEAHVPGV